MTLLWLLTGALALSVAFVLGTAWASRDRPTRASLEARCDALQARAEQAESAWFEIAELAALSDAKLELALQENRRLRAQLPYTPAHDAPRGETMVFNTTRLA